MKIVLTAKIIIILTYYIYKKIPSNFLLFVKLNVMFNSGAGTTGSGGSADPPIIEVPGQAITSDPPIFQWPRCPHINFRYYFVLFS